MKLTLTKPSKTAVASYVFFAISAVMLLFSFTMIMKVDVLANWRLVLPEGALHAGDTVVLQSLYDKKLDVTGEATRYIECKTKDTNIFVRYPVSKSVANRPAGLTGTGIVIAIPEVIPDLPATCKFTISIDYEVLAFRHVIETQSSDEFSLLPKRVASQTSEGASLGTNQTAGSASDLGSAATLAPTFFSSPNNIPVDGSEQRHMSQHSSSETPSASPSIIDSIVNLTR